MEASHIFIPHGQTGRHPPVAVTRDANPRGEGESEMISDRDLQAVACVFHAAEITTLNKI